MEPKASESRKHFYISLVKSLFRLGGCYGLWMVGSQMGEPMIQAVGVFFGIAEVLGIAEEL